MERQLRLPRQPPRPLVGMWAHANLMQPEIGSTKRAIASSAALELDCVLHMAHATDREKLLNMKAF